MTTHTDAPADDLVERLERDADAWADVCDGNDPYSAALIREAAARIRSLEAQRDEWKSEWEAVCTARIEDRDRSQTIINERDKWIVELIAQRDEAVGLLRVLEDERKRESVALPHLKRAVAVAWSKAAILDSLKDGQ